MVVYALRECETRVRFSAPRPCSEQSSQKWFVRNLFGYKLGVRDTMAFMHGNIRRTVFYSVGLCALLFVGVIIFVAIRYSNDDVVPPASLSQIAPLPTSPLNASYLLEDGEVTLSEGHADVKGSMGASDNVRTDVVGEPTVGDVNDDGLTDAVVILSRETGGSGTYLYVASALHDGNGYLGLNALPLGDRINVEKVSIENTLVRFAYLEHAPDEPLASAPTQRRERYFTVSGTTFTEVVLDEGEELFTGELFEQNETLTFSSCAGASYSVSPEARAWGALRAVYDERVRSQDSGNVYVVLGGMVVSNGEGDTTILSPRLLIAAPRAGACVVQVEQSETATSSDTAIEEDLTEDLSEVE